MNKTNIVKSSEFHMSEGDVLHYILIVDSGVTPTIGLISTRTNDNINEVPDAVTALDASDITSSSFTANWNLIENANGYYLDVATDSDFTSIVAGYDNLSVGYVNEYSVIGLTDTYTYYYRVRASNDVGTSNSSNTIIVITLNEIVMDADGNIYPYVTIGTQQWFIENLKTTKYIDGTPIPNLTLNVDWAAEDGTAGHDGAYCAYDNDPLNIPDYGLLYNWHAVNNIHGLASAGWRIPSEIDINTLSTFLGGDIVAGGKLKEDGLAHWNSPNTGATNESGFTALPGGGRNRLGTFSGIGDLGIFWASSEEGVIDGDSLTLQKSQEYLVIAVGDKINGYSVRMMRDI